MSVRALVARALARAGRGPEGWDRRRLRAPAALLLALAVLALSLQAARSRGVAITFSEELAPAEVPAIRQLLDRFQSETGIRVNLITLKSRELGDRLSADLRPGSRPTIHLFAQDNLDLFSLVDRGLVADLSGDVRIPSGVEGELVRLPSPLDGEQFKAKLYFLPFRPNVQLLYANEKVVNGAAPPATAHDLRVFAERLRTRGSEGEITLSLAPGDPAAVTLSEWIRSFGGDPLRLNDDRSVRALEYLQGMWKDGLIARQSQEGNFDTEVDYLNAGTGLLATNWPFTSAILAQEGNLGGFRVYPGLTDPAGRQVHVLGGDMLGIPRSVLGTERKAAVALAEFLTSEESQEFLANRNGWPPIYGHAYPATGEKGGLAPTLTAAHQALKGDVWLRPNTEQWRQVTCAMSEVVRRVLGEGRAVRPVVDELQPRVDAQGLCPTPAAVAR